MYILPQMIGYTNYFDDNKPISFKVSDENLLKKYINEYE